MEVIFMIICLIIIGIGYFVFENKYLKVTNYCIEQLKLPEEFNGTKLVCLTDLHNNSFGKKNRKLLEKIKKYNPDYVVIAGDMFSSAIKAKNHKAKSFILELAVHYPIYYSYGNHESRLVARESEHNLVLQYIEELKKAGVIFLDNYHVTIQKNEATLSIYGLTLPLEYFGRRKTLEPLTIDLESFIGRPEEGAYHILLAHIPVYFEEYAAWGADLVFSGHMHGGVMILPFLGGVISPQYELFPKYDYGKFEFLNSTMFLSRGLGTHTIPIRIFNRPDLLCVELKHSKEIMKGTGKDIEGDCSHD